MSLRVGGGAAVLGGLLWPLGIVIGSQGVAWAGLGMAVHIGGTVALLIALMGLSAFQARQYPVLAWAAFLLPAIGAAISIVGTVAMATMGDRPLVANVSGWSVWMIGILATLLGSVLFGLVSYRVQRVSRRGATILTLGSMLALLTLALGATGLIGESIGGPLVAVAVLGFAGGWIAMGLDALRVDRPAVGPQSA